MTGEPWSTPSRRRPGPGRPVPVSTYRFQVSKELDLHEVARLATYVHDLGADWLYLSPLLAAEPGSTHGYDVVAHDHLDPDRGGEEGRFHRRRQLLAGGGGGPRGRGPREGGEPERDVLLRPGDRRCRPRRRRRSGLRP